MKILVCGSRYWTNRQKIFDRLKELPKDTLIIEGGAKGADKLAKEVADELELEVLEIKADWYNYGKAAGIIRNTVMLSHSPDLVIAFTESLENSKGTKDTINKAIEMGIKVEIIN